MENDSKILVLWSDIKTTLESLELDVNKNAKGVAAAGVRTRKGLREVKVKVAELIKLTIELDKVKKEKEG